MAKANRPGVRSPDRAEQLATNAADSARRESKAKAESEGEKSGNGLLQAALEYGATGFAVFPCKADKTPLVPHGFKDASCDPKVIARWWIRWPDAWIGMPTGEKFVVLDLDVKNGKNGLAIVSNWADLSPVIVETGSGGRHIYCAPDDEIGCTADQIGLGVDTRGKGGYVIVPPSPGYKWVNGHDLSNLPPFPENLRPSVARETQDKKSPEELLAKDQDELIAALCAIPNNKQDYDSWKKMCMAIFAATGGSEDGAAMFHAWSKVWTEGTYDKAKTEEAWQQCKSSPPTKIGAGSIFHWADEADPGWRARFKSGLTEEQQQEIARLAALPIMQYEQERDAAAERLGIRKSVLDELVKRARPPSEEVAGQGTPLNFAPTEPWLEPVEGEKLVAEMEAVARRYVVMSEHLALAFAFWVLHAHALDCAEHSPRLHVVSPAPRCGKTTLLNLIAAMVPKPLHTEQITTASFFRVIEAEQPTLLIDEADIFLKDNDDMRALINAGHGRSGKAIRIVGDNFEPRMFKVWAPVVIAGIGRIPATIEDRSITISLRRRLPTEKIERLRSNRRGHLADLGRRAARWVADHKIALADADPVLPEKLGDREHDNWRLMVAIADAMSADLGRRVREAAVKISEEEADDETAAIMMLEDVANIFERRMVDKLSSQDLIDELTAMEDRPWNEWRHGKPMTKNSLARLLKPFGIHPGQFRFDPTKPEVTLKGYEAAPIREAKARYVGDGEAPPSPPPEKAKPAPGSRRKIR